MNAAVVAERERALHTAVAEFIIAVRTVGYRHAGAAYDHLDQAWILWASAKRTR